MAKLVRLTYILPVDEDRQKVCSFVRIAYDWCRSFIPEQEWQARKSRIQEHLLDLRRPRPRSFAAEDFASVSVSDDRFGWYLYLAETFLEATQSYEPIQGARVIPIFTQLGQHSVELSRIQGVRERFREIVSHERMNADQGLFEILTALWRCDNPKAISAKARDVRRHLAEAVGQLPPHAPSVVHIGVETIDGWPVEQERYAKICSTISGFDSTSIDLQWIYCHLFQAYSPPEKDWEFDETVYYFNKDGADPSPPLKEHSMVIPYGTVRDGAHWKPTNPV